jgi:hypothetical protein
LCERLPLAEPMKFIQTNFLEKKDYLFYVPIYPSQRISLNVVTTKDLLGRKEVEFILVKLFESDGEKGFVAEHYKIKPNGKVFFGETSLQSDKAKYREITDVEELKNRFILLNSLNSQTHNIIIKK